MAIHAYDRDRLEVDLHGPLLDQFMRSRELYAVLQAIGQDIKGAYVARVPRETNALAQSARVNMRRSTQFRDRRWEAEFSVGDSKVDYADDIENEYHPLAEALRALGYGDVVI